MAALTAIDKRVPRRQKQGKPSKLLAAYVELSDDLAEAVEAEFTTGMYISRAEIYHQAMSEWFASKKHAQEKG
jgi:hypothetical protein